MIDWRKRERGARGGWMRSKRRQSGREMKGEWGWISDGMEGEWERERGGSWWFSTVDQCEGGCNVTMASGWTEGGMDGQEEGWQGSPLASGAATGTDGVPWRTEWVPVFTCGPMGKIRLPHTCSHTRGPGMLMLHYSKMKDVLGGAGGRGGWW